MMDQISRETLLYRIITTYTYVNISGIRYVVKPPTPYQRLRANEIYNETIRKNRFDLWLTEAKCLGLLVKHKICPHTVDSNIKKFDKQIDDLKVALYKARENPKDFKDVKNQLKLVREKQEQMILDRHCFDHLTLQGFASMVKRQYLICENLYYEDDTRVWNDSDEIDFPTLEAIIRSLLKQAISTTELRDLSRNDPWKSYWNTKPDNPFGLSNPTLITDEQKGLLLFSKMYDSAYEHPECPSEDVINDDDMFDGWMILQRRNQDSKNNKDDVDQVFKNLRGKDEGFIIVKGDSIEEKRQHARKINEKNDTAAQIIKAQRDAVIKKQGFAVDAQFPDRKIQIQSQKTQQFMDSVKGGR